MKKYRSFIIIVTVILFTFSITAYALDTTKNTQLRYRNIKITLDGELLDPKDANGASVEPFIIDGTTYLPVRAISSALGMDVNWDNSTSTVELSSPPSASGTSSLDNNEVYAMYYLSTLSDVMCITAWQLYNQMNIFDEGAVGGASNPQVIYLVDTFYQRLRAIFNSYDINTDWMPWDKCEYEIVAVLDLFAILDELYELYEKHMFTYVDCYDAFTLKFGELSQAHEDLFNHFFDYFETTFPLSAN